MGEMDTEARPFFCDGLACNCMLFLPLRGIIERILDEIGCQQVKNCGIFCRSNLNILVSDEGS